MAPLLRALAMANRGDVRNACRARVADYSVERAARGIAEAYDAMARTGQHAPAGE